MGLALVLEAVRPAVSVLVSLKVQGNSGVGTRK